MMMTMMTLMHAVHCLLSTLATLQLLQIAESRTLDAIEITEARFIASNAVRVSWETHLTLSTDDMCQINMTAEGDDLLFTTKTIPISLKRYIFWNITARSNYSVSIAFIKPERLLNEKNVSFSPKQRNFPLQILQPVTLIRCEINIRHGFTKQLDISQMTEVIFTERDYITLSCTASGHPIPRVRWFKDGKPEEYGDALNLEMASKIQQGIYSCVAENRFGIAVFSGVHLKMAVLDPFSATDQTPKFTVEVGVGLKIDCRYSAHSIPAVTVGWYKLIRKNDPSPSLVSPDNVRVLLSVTGSLVFVNTETADTGLYMCMATNSELDKSVAGSLTNLEVTESRYTNFSVVPTLVFKSLETQKAFIGEDVSFQCIFSGRPIPETVWLVKDLLTKTYQPVTENSTGRFQLKENRATLVVLNVTELTPDQFSCEGRNSEGKTPSVYFQLLIYGKPRFLFAPESQNATIGDTVVFKYQVTGFPGPDIQWTTNGKPIVSGTSVIINETSLVIFNVTKEWSKSLQLNVTNNYGYTLANVFLNIFVPTVISSRQNDSVHLLEPGVVSFHCDAETDPSTPLEIRWLRNNKLIYSPFAAFPSLFTSSFSYEQSQQIVHLVDHTTLHQNLNDDLTDEWQRQVVNFTCLASNGLTTATHTFILPSRKKKKVPTATLR